MTTECDTDDELVQRARIDRQAFGQLYDRYYAGVLKHSIHRLFDRDVAEDLTSTIFLEVARQIRAFAGLTDEDFGNWLFCIATRQINAYLGKTARRRELIAKAVQEQRLRIKSDSDPDGGASLDWPRLYEAIARLSADEQAVIALRSFEELPYERIATIVGMKSGTVRVVYHRALAKLRARLEGTFGRA